MNRGVALVVLSLLFVVLQTIGCGPRLVDDPGYDELAEGPFLRTVVTLCDAEMEGRDAGSAGIDQARDFLIERFRRAGLKPGFVIEGRPSYAQPFEVQIGKASDGKPIMATVENVGAILPGVGDLAEEVVVVGAHYDHVGYGRVGLRAKENRGVLHPGADDNASGTAAVVLIARQFAEQVVEEPDMPRRTILFTCFAGEERGLRGSRYMTAHPEQWPFEPRQVSGMLNMDMVGRVRNGEIYLFTDQTGKQWRDWTNEANETVGLSLQWDVHAPGGSDHIPFIKIGIPAIFFNSWLHADYHTPRDTPDKVNILDAVRVAKLVAALTKRAASDPQRLAFAELKPRPRPHLGAKLANSEDGVKIQKVAEQSPMRNAGVKDGDILVSIDGMRLTSTSEVRLFLLKKNLGDQMQVELRRGEETLHLTVKLGVRS